MIRIELLEDEFNHETNTHFETVNVFYFTEEILQYAPKLHSYKKLSDLNMDLHKFKKNLVEFLHNEEGPAWTHEYTGMEGYFFNGLPINSNKDESK